MSPILLVSFHSDYKTPWPKIVYRRTGLLGFQLQDQGHHWGQDKGRISCNQSYHIHKSTAEFIFYGLYTRCVCSTSFHHFAHFGAQPMKISVPTFWVALPTSINIEMSPPQNHVHRPTWSRYSLIQGLLPKWIYLGCGKSAFKIYGAIVKYQSMLAVQKRNIKAGTR